MKGTSRFFILLLLIVGFVGFVWVVRPAGQHPRPSQAVAQVSQIVNPNLALQGLWLVDAFDNVRLVKLSGGDTIDIAEVGDSLSFVPDVTSSTSSVRFMVTDGLDYSITHTRNDKPYSFMGESGIENYNPMPLTMPLPAEVTVTATAYSRNSAEGDFGPTTELTFTLYDSSDPATDLPVVSVASDAPKEPVVESIVEDAAEMPAVEPVVTPVTTEETADTGFETSTGLQTLFTAGDIVQVHVVSALRVREISSLAGAIKASVPAGARARVIGEYIERDGYRWWPVHYLTKDENAVIYTGWSASGPIGDPIRYLRFLSPGL